MEKPKNKKFLEMPNLGGEKGLLKKIIKENLRYPEEAVENNIEGDVVLSYKVNNMGEVFDCKIIKGIGHGCDEEAIRLVKMLNYKAVTNRGVKVTTNNRIKIPFRIPKQKKSKINITYTSNSKKQAEDNMSDKDKDEKKDGGSYNYTISI